jgi:hypothetical protein
MLIEMTKITRSKMIEMVELPVGMEGLIFFEII